ncbi:hypothetical protein FDB41_16875 [Clostridium botulinum]|nr:hypothetical protein [Clostridium botulinum]NFO55179.1 hypothetical protein [Clostridium botulinum]
MIENIFDYFKVPTQDEVKEILNPIRDNIDKISFSCRQRNGLEALFDTRSTELLYWTREFNNRFFDFIINYEIMMNYYNSRIPDEEWYIFPGRKGESVEYFPHFENEDYAKLYIFGFYMDSLYTRYFGLIDTIYHILDGYYELEVGNSLGFIKRVINGIKKENPTLATYLESIKDDPRYIEINNFRNNQVHNYRANQVSSGLSPKVKQGNGTIMQTLSVGNYTTTSQFVNDINNGIELLREIVEEINKQLGEM